MWYKMYYKKIHNNYDVVKNKSLVLMHENKEIITN